MSQTTPPPTYLNQTTPPPTHLRQTTPPPAYVSQTTHPVEHWVDYVGVYIGALGGLRRRVQWSTGWTRLACTLEHWVD